MSEPTVRQREVRAYLAGVLDAWQPPLRGYCERAEVYAESSRMMRSASRAVLVRMLWFQADMDRFYAPIYLGAAARFDDFTPFRPPDPAPPARELPAELTGPLEHALHALSGLPTPVQTMTRDGVSHFVAIRGPHVTIEMTFDNPRAPRNDLVALMHVLDAIATAVGV